MSPDSMLLLNQCVTVYTFVGWIIGFICYTFLFCINKFQVAQSATYFISTYKLSHVFYFMTSPYVPVEVLVFVQLLPIEKALHGDSVNSISLTEYVLFIVKFTSHSHTKTFKSALDLLLTK